MFSKEKKFLFIHPPKVGGTTIHRVFEPFYSSEVGFFVKDTRKAGKGQEVGFRSPFRKHAPLSEFMKQCPEISSYYKFSIIRNPWDRMSSWFSYKTGSIPEGNTTPFKRWFFGKDDARIKILLTTYFSYRGEFALDYLLDFSDYENELKKIYYQIIGTELTNVPHYNKSKNTDYTKFYKNGNKWDYELIEQIQKVFAKDLELKKYVFGEK